ncbi:MAG: hypothetical protein ACRENY_01630 [Candidatus Dormibacteria bacterium]
MAALAVVVGAVLLVLVAGGLALLPRDGDVPPLVLQLGRRSRRWWVLGAAVALVVWVGVAASLSTSESRPFALLLALLALVLLLLACLWAWTRAKSFS